MLYEAIWTADANASNKSGSPFCLPVNSVGFITPIPTQFCNYKVFNKRFLKNQFAAAYYPSAFIIPPLSINFHIYSGALNRLNSYI